MKRKAGIIMLIAIVLFSVLFGNAGIIETDNRLIPPSLEEPFGTDTLGRSLFERTAAGVGVSILSAFAVMLFSIVIGVMLSFLYTLPHFPEEVILSLSDSLKAIPSIILALFFASISGPGIVKMIIAISISHISDIARTSYTRVSALLSEDFIEAERAIGSSSFKIFRKMFRHLCPYLSLQAVTVFLSALMAEATLSYLGCGIPVTIPSLGSILAEARPVMLSAPWMIAFPAIVLGLLGLSLELIALSFSELDTSSEGSHERELVSITKVSSDRKA
ncbi:MAG: ABC transporter permease [Spirochaetes bacterium]|uniref:ABC transporter permease n=1 Tax=Candidatus Ornithospirochaeta stercoripullorum TaxID=2840899 RepID=A0A9D9H2Y0_9SPIO|nr:ABC transporter permease [Candidatus Ornithospirochaeta stercoripullorum]